MILTKQEIKRALSSKEGQHIVIDPFTEEQLNPNSYDLTLAPLLKTYMAPTLDVKREHRCDSIKIPKKGLVLQPNRLYLGSTNEWTETYGLVPMIEGKSSLGRLGLSVHITAGFGDVGFKGTWTLEIHCIQPIIIYSNMRVAQIFYHTIKGEESHYNGKYQGQQEAQPARIS